MISFLQAGMAFLAITVAAIILWFIHQAAPRKTLLAFAVIAAFMTAQLLLANSGVLSKWNGTPPPFIAMMAVTLLATCGLAFSPLGLSMASSLPFAMLIGFQAFRLPLELLMHRAADQGVMPVVMSFSGYNFDILTGLTAIPAAWMVHRNSAPRWLPVAWNLMGCALLATIVAIAVAATPRFAAFGPQQLNTWIADAPFVWLPGVLVQAALLGHLLTWRKLLCS